MKILPSVSVLFRSVSCSQIQNDVNVPTSEQRTALMCHNCGNLDVSQQSHKTPKPRSYFIDSYESCGDQDEADEFAENNRFVHVIGGQIN